MKNLSEQYIERTELGLKKVPVFGMGMVPEKNLEGIPDRISVQNRRWNNETDEHGRPGFPLRRDSVEGFISFKGYDDNEPHAIRLDLTPELAQVIGTGMVSAAFTSGSDVYSKTVINEDSETEGSN